jgi:hypothetical protein
MPDSYYVYYKSIRIYYYYPKEMTVKNVMRGSYTIDPTIGLVLFTVNNQYGPREFYLSLQASGVVPGTYTTPAPVKIEIETFDGERRTVNVGNYSITILDPAAIKNKLDLSVDNRTYNAGLGDDYWIQ